MGYNKATQVWSPMSLEEATKQYLVYTYRLRQLKRETTVANRMVREALETIENMASVPTEYLTWDAS